MNKREFLRLESWDQSRVIEELARDINAKLNLFGRETIEELVEAAREGEGEDERLVANLLTPGPDFPRAFCEAARPSCNQFLRHARYWRHARS